MVVAPPDRNGAVSCFHLVGGSIWLARETKGDLLVAKKEGGKKKAKAIVVATGPRETPVIGWNVPTTEFDERVSRVRTELEKRELDGLVLFHPIRMAYVSGFFHLSTEKPMAIVI